METLSSEKPFSHCKIYFSGSIKGMQVEDPVFSWNFVQHMIDKGADVLSEHVAGRTRAEIDGIFQKRTGFDREKSKDPWNFVWPKEKEWLEECTHLVAIVDSPSHGVGMEIMYALERGKPILCLIHEENLDRLSWTIRGSAVRIETYTSFEDAIQSVTSFLCPENLEQE